MPHCRALLTAFALFALPGCGGHLLARDEMPQLQPTDGLIVLAADVNRRTSLKFCRDADLLHCVDFPALSPVDRIAVAQVVAGRYCLAGIFAEALNGATALTIEVEPAKTRCFDVAAGTVAYPGHFVFQVRELQTLAVNYALGWEWRTSIEPELRAAYPKLADWPLHKVETHRFTGR